MQVPVEEPELTGHLLRDQDVHQVPVLVECLLLEVTKKELHLQDNVHYCVQRWVVLQVVVLVQKE